VREGGEGMSATPTSGGRYCRVQTTEEWCS
jgi:hypothetical protein